MNPATGEVLALLPQAGREDIDRRCRGGAERVHGAVASGRPGRAAATYCCFVLPTAVDEHVEELALIEAPRYRCGGPLTRTRVIA